MLHKSTAGHQAGPSTELELVNSGAGWAWLRPERDGLIDRADQLASDVDRVFGRRRQAPPDGSESPRVALTQRGEDLLRCWRAEVALFGAEVS